MTTAPDLSPTERLERARQILRDFLLWWAPAEKWEPFDAVGDYSGVDMSRSHDIHSHGYATALWVTARRVREVLVLLEALEAKE